MKNNKSIIFQFCTYDEIDSVKKAIAKWVNKRHILSTNSSIINFQHKLDDGYSFILAKKQNTLIGILGYIPTHLYDLSLKNELQYATVSWFVDLDLNLPGLGMLLFRNLLSKKKAKFCFALSISERAFLMHEALGYKIGWMQQVYLANHSIKKFKLLQNIPSIKKLVSISNYRLKLLDLENFDELTKDFIAPKDIVPTKSAVYFKNRFLMHPIYQYKVYGIFRKRDLQSLIATRLVKANGAKAMRLVDFVGDLESLYSIAPDLQELLIIENAEYMDLYHSGLNPTALKSGGFLSRSQTSNTVVPNYFEPFEASNVDLNFAYRFRKSEDKKKVLLFKADGDQDRPN